MKRGWTSVREKATLLVLASAVLWAPLTLGAQSREGVDVGSNSVFTKLSSAEEMEHRAQLQYHQQLEQAAQKRALAPEGVPNFV